MGRPRKEDKQQKETAELMISVEDFARTRDSVVTGLTTLQTAVSDLLRSYLKHTNSVLGSTPYRLDTFGISNPLNNNEILAGALRDSPPAAAGPATAAAAPQPIAAPVAAPAAPAEEEPVKKGRKPKKEKKEKDPNEPKRPLTMYFLYSAQARPIVKEDLGPTVTPGAVEEEIKKRWRELGDEEKKAWKDVYNKNRDEYLVKIAEYKASKGEAAAADILAEAADADVEMGEGAATAAGATADESTPSEDESEKEASPPKAPTPPVENKTPKPKRRKTGKENGVVAASSAAAPAHTASPIPLPSHPKNAVEITPAKPANTRKAAAKKEEAPKEAPKETVEEPAKRKRGRKSKGAEEVAAAAEAAPEPEKKNKRKRKSEGATA